VFPKLLRASIVCTSGNQYPCHQIMLLLRSEMQRREPIPIDKIYLGTRINQHPRPVEITVERRIVKRGPSAAVEERIHADVADHVVRKRTTLPLIERITTRVELLELPR
jgi:hypothetical protein